ncbi:adenylate/guanylate cyclase domain-containing protein [Qipengyuania sp. DY56-A-20]|jgi:class 3 adenylate cyclase|uniref:Adenylate/guanylate cyclase domain-containing protein n=1 Tax=Qipengyuania benthica TaxID=3067651 RepID=A0ABT9HCA7_9SPHN|nr:adenylate/guanylate cyclase domain-containing protein [Qipengyuania sp. DY56-A-20]MDP4540961.1 adenylate/guanylate cyclase domain-containing protein [Qipengyuania sp. DY56-A-20]
MGSTIEQASEPAEGRSEKRQLAVLFADLADSTALCSVIGDERFHALTLDFLGGAAKLVEASGGYVARFMGDGLLAYFGYPAAGEDDSVRAVRAALAVRELVSEIGAAAEIPLAMRAGVATGTVMLGTWLGSGAARERPVTGDAANLAARLQSAAQPNGILVAESTHALARSAFQFEECLSLSLKGIDGCTRAFAVSGAAGWDHRPWIGQSEANRLVGRVAELHTLQAHFAEAASGAIRRIAIQGEPGIGKSTLVGAFVSGLDRSACRVVHGAANPGYANLPFFLAGQFFTDDVFAAEYDSAGSAEAFINRAADRLLAEPGSGPLVVVAEDLHWSDPSSLSFLAALTERAAAGFLLIFTSRAALPPVLADIDEALHLSPLNDVDMAALIQQIAPTALASAAVLDIVKRAGGVPLFGVELARLNADGGDRLPWSLSELLTSRLTDLGGSLRLAQCLAVLGPSAEMPLLAKVSDLAADEFATVIQTLEATKAVRIYRHGVTDRAIFSHALIQEAIYRLLLERDRKTLHRRAAVAIEVSGAGRDVLDDLARHWNACDEFGHAASVYAAAAEAHRLHFGYAESEHAVEHGLDALKRLAPSPQRDRIELDLQSTLASVLQINLGYSNARATAAANRAKALAERHGEVTRRFQGLAGQWMAASSAGDYATGASAARQMLLLANSVGGHELLAAAWMAQLTSRFRMGDITGAEEAFQQGERFFAAPAFASRPGGIAQTYGNAALIAVLRGDPAGARARAAFALRNGRRMRSNYDICFAAYMAGMLCLMLGADRMAQRWSTRSSGLATRIGFPQFSAIAQVVLGRAMAGQGEVKTGIDTIRSGIAAMDTTGSRVGLTLYLSWLAEAEYFGDLADAATLTLDQALSANPEERFYLPETLRLKARILSAANESESADALLAEARSLATEVGGQWFLRRIALDDGGAQPMAAR